MTNSQICEHCGVDYDQDDPEWKRWVGEPGFCCDDHFRAFEAILEVGEEEYNRLVDEYEEETDYGEGSIPGDEETFNNGCGW